MLKIRLRRVGKRHQPSYRIVVVEHTAPAQGSYLEAVGFYNPRAKKPELTVKEDRVLHWLNHGAQPSERMAKLLVSVGVKHNSIVLPDYDKKPKRAKKKAAPEASKAAAETAATESVDAAPQETEVTEEVSAEESASTPNETPTKPEAEPTTETATEGGSSPQPEAETPEA